MIFQTRVTCLNFPLFKDFVFTSGTKEKYTNQP